MTAVRVLRMSELGAELESAWAEIQRSEPLLESPFFHPQFTRLVANARDDVHVGVLEDGGAAVGFFPFQRDGRGIGRPVGHGLNDYQGVIARPGAEWSTRELIRACGLRWFEFDHVPAAQEQWLPHRRSSAVSPVVEMPDGFEAYESERREAGVKTIKRLRSRMRRLERDHGPVRFETDVRDPELLAALLRWKSARYTSTGAADLLAEGWFRDVVEASFGVESDGFACPLSVLWAGERPVAMHLGPRSRTVWHYWLPAHDDDPELSRTSPGMLLILAMAEHADELGVRALDFGKGDARHKLEFANAEISLAAGSVGTLSAVAAVQRARQGVRSLARRSGLGPRLRRLRRS